MTRILPKRLISLLGERSCRYVLHHTFCSGSFACKDLANKSYRFIPQNWDTATNGRVRDNGLCLIGVDQVITEAGAFDEYKVETTCLNIEEVNTSAEISHCLDQLPFKLSSADIVEVVARLSNLHTAIDFFIWAKSRETYKVDIFVYSMIIERLGRQSKFGHVRRLVKEMQEKNMKIPEELLVAVIRNFGEAGKAMDALKFFNEMNDLGYEPSSSMFNCVFEVLLTYAYNRQARVILKKMDEAGFELSETNSQLFMRTIGKPDKVDLSYDNFLHTVENGQFPGIQVYSDLLISLCKGHKIDKAFSLYGCMRHRGIVPNEVGYCTFLSTLGNNKRTDKAHDVFRDMLIHNIKPSFESCLLIMTKLIQDCKMPLAEDLLPELSNVYPLDHLQAIRAFVKHLSNAELIKSTWKLMQEMKALGPLPDQTTYDRINLSFGKVLKLGLNCASAIEAGGCPRLLPCNILVEALGKANQPEAGWKFVQFMADQGWGVNEYTYANLLNNLYKHGRLDIAERIFLVLEEKGYSVDGNMCNAILRRLANDGNIDAALRVLEEMIQRGYQPDAFICNMLIERLCKLGRPNAVNTLLEKGSTIADKSMLRLCSQ